MNKDLVRYKYTINKNDPEKNACAIHIGKNVARELDFNLGDRLIIRKSSEHSDMCKSFILEKSLFGNVLRPYSVPKFSNFIQVFFIERIRYHFKLPKNCIPKNLEEWKIQKDGTLWIKFL